MFDLKFFWLEIFHKLGLIIGLGHNGIYWSIVLMALLINVTTTKGLHFDFDFSFNSFFDKNISIIKFLVFFINS